MHVPGRTGTDPGRELVRDGPVVGSLSVVAELARNRSPPWSVPHPRPGEGMSDLVQEHLVDLVVFVTTGKVPGNGDPVLVEVAQAGPGLGIVEAKAPDRRVEVERNESLSPRSHPVQFSHASNLSRPEGFALAGAPSVGFAQDFTRVEESISALPSAAEPGRCSAKAAVRESLWHPW
jgi:hypothetical protein